MSRTVLRLWAAGLDPYVFFVGDVEVHVYIGAPPGTPQTAGPVQPLPPERVLPAPVAPSTPSEPFELTRIDPAYSALRVQSPSDMAYLLQEASSDGGWISLTLEQSESGPESAAQLEAVLIGLQQYPGDADVDVSVVADGNAERYASHHDWD